ncbi:MAG: hypothetical protein WCA09_16165 [Burkholderiales bacterium]
MSYKVAFEQKPGYVHAVVTGRNSSENVARYLEDVGRECLARGASRVLIEERLEGPRLAATEVFDVASGGAARGAGQLPVIAYVDVYAEGTLMKFAEDVAVNRGVRVRVFATVAEAALWLRQLSADSPSGSDKSRP